MITSDFSTWAFLIEAVLMILYSLYHDWCLLIDFLSGGTTSTTKHLFTCSTAFLEHQQNHQPNFHWSMKSQRNGLPKGTIYGPWRLALFSSVLAMILPSRMPALRLCSRRRPCVGTMTTNHCRVGHEQRQQHAAAIALKLTSCFSLTAQEHGNMPWQAMFGCSPEDQLGLLGNHAFWLMTSSGLLENPRLEWT